MTPPTDSQWARYSALCAHLQALPTAGRQGQLAAWQGAGAEDPQVLALVALHYALPPDPDRDRSGERIGSCILEAPLGAGGMGIVYRAQQHLGPTTRPVAVKLIHPALLRTAREEALARFQAEIGTLVQLEHEGIARIYEGGTHVDPRTHEPLPYLAMELIRDGLPITMYTQDYALPWSERLRLFLRVCRAVQYAHEHRIVHRDLKPTNILVDREGRPFVIDFGLALACNALLPGVHLASGTPAYMSPEQVAPVLGAISDRSDVYALGLILYELLTGQLPYTLPRDGTVAQWRHAILEATPPPLSAYHAAYSGELEALVAATLVQRPAARLSVAAFQARLARYLQAHAPASDPLRPGSGALTVSRPVPTGAAAPRKEPRPGSAYGGAMRPQPDLVTSAHAQPSLAAAERRHLTVMFCDLVGSTRLSGLLDPEDLRTVMQAYHQMCAAVIHRFDGYIAQYLGDGLLVYFGYPAAHDDDALRAVRAGLGLLHALEPLNAQLTLPPGERLAVHLGVHTGLAVVGPVGDGARQEPLAFGETPNLAARLQGLAAPNTLVVSAATWRLLSGFFAGQSLGPQRLTGQDEPLEVYQVLSETTARSRLDAARRTGLTPLVGREQEIVLLRERWAQVKDGVGQVVLLSGEAGIGKSRLVEVLQDQVATESQGWLTLCQCSPYYQHTVLYPVIELLERVALQFDREEPPQQKLSKLEGFVVQYGLPLAEAVPLLATLLSLPLTADYTPLTLSPEQQKHKTLHVLLTIMLRIAAQQPLFFVMEDLHWSDPTTLEFLTLLVDQGPTARILALWTFRPDFSSPWTGRSHLTQVTLPRLPQRQAAEMTNRVAYGKALPPEVVAQVVSKTDGVPLFVEELTKMVLESGLLQECEERYALTGPLPPLSIPATLHDSLLARLDRLGTVKGLAQLGATLGREFSYALLQAVSPWDEETLRRGLHQLVAAEFLYQEDLPPQATYRFKHSLIQDAAYQSLLRSTRQQYHQGIAEVLEVHFPETAETQPELLAHHYTEAGLSEHAVDYWQRAGERAVARSAHMEAIGHLSRGLAVLMDLSDTPERRQRELALQISQGVSLTAIKGYGAPEVERAYTRARALCQQLGETPQLFPALYGLWRFYLLRAEYAPAQELGEHLLTLAEYGQEPTSLAAAHRAMGSTLFYLGELPTAYKHLQHVMTFDPTPRDRSQTFLYDVADVWITCHTYAAWTLWLLGYPDQARQMSDTAITMAQDLNHPFSYALALSFDAWLHQFCGVVPRTQERAVTAIALSTEQGFKFWMGWNTVIEGWALAKQGHDQQGIVQMSQGLADWHATGSELGHAYFLTLMAEIQGERGELVKGLHILAEAQAFTNRTDEHWWEAELYRLKGELLLRQVVPDMSQAVACFHYALDVARQQNGKSLELRAAKSLSRLWQQQGKQEEAHTLLAPIYNWFSEGFDTADLQDAKALLEVLSQGI